MAATDWFPGSSPRATAQTAGPAGEPTSERNSALASTTAGVLEAAARGETQAWRRLTDDYGPRVYGLLLSRCRDGELAEELTQATFVKLVSLVMDRRRYREQGRFEALLFKIAMNHLRDEMRRRRRQAQPTDMSPAATAPSQASGPATLALTDEADPSAPLERQEQLGQLRACVARLPEADQELLHLRHTAGMSFAEIASTLDQPLGTVLARGHRALQKLRKLMEPDDSPSPNRERHTP